MEATLADDTIPHSAPSTQPPSAAIEVQPYLSSTPLGWRYGRKAGHSQIVQSGDVAWVALTQELWATIDASDIPLVAAFSWYAKPNGLGHYAISSGKNRLRMHRVITDRMVDHWDRNGLNNCRYNLRPCTHAQNMRNIGLLSTNTSGFKGVTFDKFTNRWMAKIRRDGKHINLGRFKTPQEAAVVYEQEARRIHGEFVRLK